MQTVAVANQKGGSGKTTTAVNMAAALSELGHRVLLVDLDPQSSASDWLGVADSEGALHAALLKGGELRGLVRETAIERVAIIPASSALWEAESDLTRKLAWESRLRRGLDSIDGRAFDVCLIDCPPSLGALSVNALTAAHAVLVTVEASAMALAGVAGLVDLIENVRAHAGNPELRLGGLLVCRVRPQTKIGEEVPAILRGQYKDLVFRTVIRESVRLTEAPSHRLPITIYDKAGAGAEDYRAAAREFVKRFGV